MPATTFPTYTYLAGAASVVPNDLAKSRPGLEGKVRDAILVGFTIAEHGNEDGSYQPAYAEDGSPRNNDALRVDAAIGKVLSLKGEPELFAIARRKVAAAIDAGSWNNYMKREVQAAGNSRAGQYRTARGTPNLMLLAMASTAAARVAIMAPRRDDPADTAQAMALQAANDTGQDVLPGLGMDRDAAPQRSAPEPRPEPRRPAGKTPAHVAAAQPDMFEFVGKAA